MIFPSSPRSLATVLGAFLTTLPVGAVVMSFDDIGLQHGQVVRNQYNGQIPGKDFGVQISMVRATPLVVSGNTVDAAVAFNTELAASIPAPSGAPGSYGFDDDLTRQVGGSGNTAGVWDGGNLPNNTNAGFALIVPENAFGYNPATEASDDIFNAPDDLAGSAGTIRFTIDFAQVFYNEVRFIIADFEEPNAYTITLTGVNNSVQSYTANAFNEPSDNNALTLLPFVGLTTNGIFNGPRTGEALRRVDFTFNNASGAIATVEMIPEPGMAAWSAAAFLALARRRRSA